MATSKPHDREYILTASTDASKLSGINVCFSCPHHVNGTDDAQEEPWKNAPWTDIIVHLKEYRRGELVSVFQLWQFVEASEAS